MAAPFSEAMALLPLGEGSYEGLISADWTIGPKVHGGTLQALCAAAGQRELALPGVEPVATSSEFLGAPDPDVPVVLSVRVRKRGRRVSVADIELAQNGRTAVYCTVTYAAVDSGDPVHLVPSPALAMPPEPPQDALVYEDSDISKIVHVANVCDLRMSRESAAFLRGETGAAEVQLWARPHGEEPNPLFAILCADMSPPVTMQLGKFGWAPTVQLTTYVRAVPSPGWLRIVSTSSVIGETWFEEDHVVVDQSGAVVAQSRQLAMVPTAV